MLSRFRPRHSAIAFDVGTAGIRAFQVAARGPRLAGRDALSLDLTQKSRALPSARPQAAGPAPDPPPLPDYSRIARLVGQGNFAGRDVALVLSPPDVSFSALRLPKQALTQPEKRLRQALAWEVARETRADASELEVRHWRLPPGHQQGLNVMAVALPMQQALTWHKSFAEDGLRLSRIDVAPCALAHLARRIWTPANNELWGVLDLGFRRSTLTVVLGEVPTYIRVLPVSADAWTGRLACAFEVGRAGAEQIKRAHGIRPVDRGVRPLEPGQSMMNAGDIPSLVFGLLRESLQDLVSEVDRCFAYVMQNYAEVNATRLLLAGGGANLRGLAHYLETQLDLSVTLLASAEETGSGAWERPLQSAAVQPETAAALGGAILDVETP